jgi:hypothetical protein
VLLVLASLHGVPLTAQEPPGAPAGNAADVSSAAGADTDPTKPVAFSLRDEYYDLGGGTWQNVVMLRSDRLVLKRTELPGPARGLITRFDLPFVSFHSADHTSSGLGDLYAQALVLPRVSPNFVMAYGLGLSLPTASSSNLGQGKWVAAPAVAPVWFFPKKGLCFVKVQDWISLAGSSDRPDIHYMTVTPTLLWRLTRRWWTVLSAESRTDWEQNNQTGYKTGALLGYMLSPRVGASVTVESFHTDHRQAEWDVKAVVFMTRF